MSYRVWITADVETEEEATKLLGTLNEAVGQANADLNDDGYEDLDDDDTESFMQQVREQRTLDREA